MSLLGIPTELIRHLQSYLLHLDTLRLSHTSARFRAILQTDLVRVKAIIFEAERWCITETSRQNARRCYINVERSFNLRRLRICGASKPDKDDDLADGFDDFDQMLELSGMNVSNRVDKKEQCNSDSNKLHKGPARTAFIMLCLPSLVALELHDYQEDLGHVAKILRSVQEKQTFFFPHLKEISLYAHCDLVDLQKGYHAVLSYHVETIFGYFEGCQRFLRLDVDLQTEADKSLAINCPPEHSKAVTRADIEFRGYSPVAKVTFLFACTCILSVINRPQEWYIYDEQPCNYHVETFFEQFPMVKSIRLWIEAEGATLPMEECKLPSSPKTSFT